MSWMISSAKRLKSMVWGASTPETSNQSVPTSASMTSTSTVELTPPSPSILQAQANRLFRDEQSPSPSPPRIRKVRKKQQNRLYPNLEEASLTGEAMDTYPATPGSRSLYGGLRREKKSGHHPALIEGVTVKSIWKQQPPESSQLLDKPIPTLNDIDSMFPSDVFNLSKEVVARNGAVAPKAITNYCVSSASTMEVIFSGNGIARMLHNVSNPRCNGLDIELDELKEMGEVTSSSTSLLVSDVPANLYRDLGLLIDARECKVHCIYPEDAGTVRRDKFKRQVKWNPVKKLHCIFNSKNNSFDIPAEPPIRFKAPKRKVESLSTLKVMLINKYQENIERLSHNEVVLDYSITSCIGIIATKNRNLVFNQAAKDQKVIETALTLQDRIESAFKILLPIIIYDCETGRCDEYSIST